VFSEEQNIADEKKLYKASQNIIYKRLNFLETHTNQQISIAKLGLIILTMAYESEAQETRYQLKIEKNQQIFKQEYYTYIRIRINFDISSDVFVLQLGVDISHKQFTFPGS